MDEFWLVWAYDGGAPTVPHGSEEAAKAEAVRLARLHGGVRFVVLKAIAFCEKRDVSWSPMRPARDHGHTPF